MATIRSETQRGLRVLAGLEAAEAALLAATAGALWLTWRLGLPRPLAALACAAEGVLGSGLALVRWPPGPAGERLAAWLLRAARYAGAVARRRAQCLWPRGSGAPGQEPAVLRGQLRVWWLEGGHGPRDGASAAAAYLEMLHALEGPLQLVVESRPLGAPDRPPGWDPTVVLEAQQAVARAYAEHWQQLTVRRCLFQRRCSAVPLGDGRRSALAGEEALRSFAARAGLRLRDASPPEVAGVLRQALGQGGELRGWSGEGAFWCVRGAPR